MKYSLCTSMVIISVILFLFRCANVGQPTGGPKDLEPPALLSTTPEDQTINFTEKKVQFIFSEPVKLEDVKKQVIITPPIEEDKYELKVKNNIVTFQLKENLQDNTTYTVNLGESVRDITEGNKVRNIKLGFSTGSFIDSLTIAGTVTHLMQGKPAYNAIVGLYNANDTLDIFDKRPLYLTKTDSSGNFQLTNLKNDSYKLYSFIDKNDNLINDPLTEAFGFKSEIYTLDSAIDNVNIRLFKQDINDLKIQSSRPDGQYFLIKFNKYVKDYQLVSEVPGVDLTHNIIENNKTIRVYNTIDRDSLKASVVAYDTLNKQLNDEVSIFFVQSRKPKEPFSYTFSPSEKDKITENFQMELFFTKPVIKVISDSMYFKFDSLNIVPIDSETDFQWNQVKDKLTITKKLNKNLVSSNNSSEAIPQTNNRNLTNGSTSEGTVQLYIAPGSFISIENDSSKVLDNKYRFLNSQETGTIEGNIVTDKENFVVQLLDKNLKLVSEIKNKKKYRFENVKPGDYKIRILIDNNGDGSWTPGDILEFREPEDVFFYEELITIRANWERNDINISF